MLDGMAEALRRFDVGFLERKELTSRACAIKLVVSDWSGVLGDSDGQSSLSDGVGIDLLRVAGMRTAIVTSEPSTIVARRAEALGTSHVFVGVRDKAAHMQMIADDAGLDFEEIAFITSDESDLVLLRDISRVGLTGTPGGAPDPLLDVVHFRCQRPAGSGAFREFADWIRELRRVPSELQ